MPGVPCSRGCEACRKRKKKCDRAKPSCTRCKRLHIKCVGAGVQRYIFVRQESKPLAENLSPAPSNNTSIIVSQLVGVLEIADIRFDLSVYGNFFKDLPRRLGTNEAIDASVYALTSAYIGVHTRQFSPETYDRYGQALKALRKCLIDPIETRTPETLCALYLITICHGWIGENDEEFVRHGEALAYLVNAAASQNWQGTFESELLHTLSTLVIFESFFNHKIEIYPWFRNMPESFLPANSHDAGATIESLKPSNLVRLPAMVRSPDQYILEINVTYTQMKMDCMKMSRIMAQLQSVSPDPIKVPAVEKLHFQRLHVRYQTGWAALLCLSLIFNTILSSYNVFEDIKLAEAEDLVDDVISVATDASQYRPLAASFMPVAIVFSLAITHDLDRRSRLESLLGEYEDDFVSANWMQLAVWMRNRMKNPCLAFFSIILPQFEGLRRKAYRCYAI